MAATLGFLVKRSSIGERGQWPNLLPLSPVLLVLLILFVLPILEIIVRSFYSDGFTFQYYRQVFSDPVYFKVMLLTFRMVTVVTVVCLALGYPLAYMMTRLSGRLRAILRVLILLPLLTSVIVRSYAWMILLSTNGVINHSLMALNLTDRPIKLMYNFSGVIVGMVYVMVPFMVLTLESVMRNMDTSLMRAAHNLGASKWQAFWRVFLPLSLPGVAASALLVFIMSLGYYITPALLGGPSDVVIATLIANQVEISMNWSIASSIASILLVMTLIGFVVCNRILRLQQIFESRG